MPCSIDRSLGVAAPLALLMLSCQPTPFAIDYGGIDHTKQGVSCRQGLTLDPARGCVGDLVRADGIPVALGFKSELGATFVVVGLNCLLDHQMILHASNVDLTAPRIGLYEGNIAAGPHELDIELFLQGNGVGIFSYLKGYRFVVRRHHNVTISGPLHIVVAAEEKGEIGTPLEERPALRFEERPLTNLNPERSLLKPIEDPGSTLLPQR